MFFTSRWRHNGRDGVSNHQPRDCLLNRLFRRRSKKTSKLCVTGLCAGNSPVTGEFPAQMASNAENVSISWRHHGQCSLTPWLFNIDKLYRVFGNFRKKHGYIYQSSMTHICMKRWCQKWRKTNSITRHPIQPRLRWPQARKNVPTYAYTDISNKLDKVLISDFRVILGTNT